MRYKGKSLFGKTLVFICLACISILGIGAGTCRSDTRVNGTITEDTVWSLKRSPYLVTDDLVLAQGVKLTIEPGVVIRVSPQKTFMVEGTLIAIGEESEPITFTKSSSDVWGVLHFTDFSEDAVIDDEMNYVSGSVLQHCIVEYGKGIFCRFGSPLISKCTIRKNESSGIRVELGAPTVVDNLIYENSTETDPASGNGAGIITFTDKSMVLARNIIRDNRSIDGRYGGGGICAYAYEDGRVDIIDNVVFNNYSSTHAGGIFAYKCKVENNLVVGNRCELTGGGINVIESSVTGNLVDFNQGNGGGGIYSENSEVSFNSVVRNRTGSSYGGGMYFFGSGIIQHNAVMYNLCDNPTKSAGIYVSGSPSINYNAVCANKGFSLYLGNPRRSPILEARHNFWGLPDEDIIISALYDWFDDNERGLVNYSDYLESWEEQALPVPPTGLTASSSAQGVEVRWSHSPRQAIAGYRVYYDSDPGYPYDNVVDVGSTDSCIISGLEPGTTYYVAVRAYRNAAGKLRDQSAFSEQLPVRFSSFDGRPPAMPQNLLPVAGETGVSPEPTLTSTAFSDPDADRHAASRWQITATRGEYGIPVFDSGPVGAMANSMKVPAGVLDNGRQYSWRVCYKDVAGDWSPWSAETDFVTAKRSPSVLSGPVSTDTAWPRDDSPYVLVGNILVRDDATLTIEPGVTVRIDPDRSFMVRGKLVAVGEPDRPITFTRNSDRPWGQFIFADASVDAVVDEDGNCRDGSIVKGCVIEYGRGVLVESSSPFLAESIIRYQEGSGVTIRKGGPTLLQNQIVANKSDGDGGGIYAYTNDLAYIRNNLIKDNEAHADGGGIFAYGYRSTTAINILDNEISGNSSEGNGGGVYASRATIAGNKISNNRAASRGGGLYTTFSIADRNEFEGNTANEGGGIFAERNSTIRYNKVTGNKCSSPYGGGVYINYWGRSVENEVFSFNDVTKNRAVSRADNGGVFVKGYLAFEKNNIFDNTGYELYNGNTADLPPLETINCYWGSSTQKNIERKIFHNKDDERLGLVSYVPFAPEAWEEF